MFEPDRPKYQSVGLEIEQAIRDGRLPPGQRLPGEFDLARRYQVSRATVRQALALLANQKLISTFPGSGSYVAFDHERLEESLGLSTALFRKGTATSVRVLRCDLVEDRELAARFGLECVRFIAVDRLRELADNSRISLERSRIPYSRQTAPLLELDFARESLTQNLIDLGLVATAGEEWIEVTQLSELETEMLAQSPGSAFLLVRRSTWGRAGELVEHVTSLLDPAHFQLHREVPER